MPPVTYTGTSGTAAPTCAPSANCTTMGSINTPAFNAIYNRMKLFLPELKRNAVVVQYSNSGLGYAGDPGAADVAPLVTVSLLPGSIQFQPITLILFKTSIGLPSFSAALTLEDAKGSASN